MFRFNPTSKRIVWFAIIVISIAGLAFLSAGFLRTMKIMTGSARIAAESSRQESQPSADGSIVKRKNTLSVLILGDSIARGTGDEKGRGLSGYLPDLLRILTPKEISVTNLGIDGLKSAELHDRITSGRMNGAIGSADIIVISIGGNDLLATLRQNDLSREDTVNRIMNPYLAALSDSLKFIRSHNREATVCVLGLYDPFPENGGDENSYLLELWNYRTESVVNADPRNAFVATDGVFRLNTKRFVAPDGIHPNSSGYQAIASLIRTASENSVTR